MEGGRVAFDLRPFPAPLDDVYALGSQRHRADPVAVLPRFLPDHGLPHLRPVLPVVQHGHRRRQRLPYGFLVRNVHRHGPAVQRGSAVHRFIRGEGCIGSPGFRHRQRKPEGFGGCSVLPRQHRFRRVAARGQRCRQRRGSFSFLHAGCLRDAVFAFPGGYRHRTPLCRPEGYRHPPAGFHGVRVRRRPDQHGNHPTDHDRGFRRLPVHFQPQRPAALRHGQSAPRAVPVQSILPRVYRAVFRHAGHGLALPVGYVDIARPVFRYGECDHGRLSGQHFAAGYRNAQFRRLRPCRFARQTPRQQRRRQQQDPQSLHLSLPHTVFVVSIIPSASGSRVRSRPARSASQGKRAAPAAPRGA